MGGWGALQISVERLICAELHHWEHFGHAKRFQNPEFTPRGRQKLSSASQQPLMHSSIGESSSWVSTSTVGSLPWWGATFEVKTSFLVNHPPHIIRGSNRGGARSDDSLLYQLAPGKLYYVGHVL